MSKQNKMKYNFLSLFAASLMIIGQRILLTATVAPSYTSNPFRFYGYQCLIAVFLIGSNLIPLYLGFYSEKLREKKPIKKIGQYYLIYFLLVFLSNIFFFFLRNSLNIKEYWAILFPVSQNYFQYAVSVMLVVLAIPFLVPLLNTVSDQLFKKALTIVSIAFIASTTLFSKDLWGFGDGKNLLWIFYLFILGYGLARFDSLKKIKKPEVHLVASLVLLLGGIFFMAQVSLAIRDNISSATRFLVPFSLFAMYYTVSFFLVLEKIQKKISRFKVSHQFLAAFLIAVQVLTSWSLTNYIISTFYTETYPYSGLQWLLAIAMFFGFYLLATIVMTLIGYLVQLSPPFKFLAKKMSFISLQQLQAKAKIFYDWLKNKRRVFYVIIFFYIFTIIQMFVLSGNEIAVSVSNTVNSYFYILFHRQPAIFLNVIVITLFFLLLFYLTSRYWYAFIFTILADLLITVSNFLKMTMREEPILPSDLTMISGINEILNYVNPVILILAVIVLILLTFSAFSLERRTKKMYKIKFGWKNKLIKIGLILAFFGSITFVNHKNSPSYLFFNLFGINRYFYNQALGAKINGPIIQFLNNIDTTIMDEPSGYSKAKIEAIMAKYNQEAETINQERDDWASNQTVIFNLSESFSDPSRVPNLTIDGDPISAIKKIKKSTTSGLMLSNGYGGGTANMEWASLTSLDISNLDPTLPTPYTQLVEKQGTSPNITNLFDESVAIHPYVATLYNRKSVYKKFGFNKFYYLGSEDVLTYTDKLENSPYVSDDSAYKDTLEVLKSNMSTTQFIQLSTMQNHMPYDNYYAENDYSATGTAVINSKQSELNTYMQGIHYTSEDVAAFIKELDKIEKPITFVFYGDHLPSLYSGNSMATYGLEQHETDYFIYNNKYSREHSKKMKYQIVSPYNFSALALEQANIKVTPYYALITKLTEDVLPSTTDPAASVSNNYNGEKVFVTAANKMLTEGNLTKKQKQIIKDYKLIEYDLTAGEQYSAQWAEASVSQ